MQTWDSIEAFEAFLDGGGMVEPRDDMPEDYRRRCSASSSCTPTASTWAGCASATGCPGRRGSTASSASWPRPRTRSATPTCSTWWRPTWASRPATQMLDDLFAGRTRFHNVFHYATATWADQVAIAFLVDAAALASQQAVFKDCSYGPYKRILRRIVAEEGFHMRQGEEMLLSLAEGTADTAPRCSRRPSTAGGCRRCSFFGPPSKPDDALLRWHIKSERNEALRDTLRAEVRAPARRLRLHDSGP